MNSARHETDRRTTWLMLGVAVGVLMVIAIGVLIQTLQGISAFIGVVVILGLAAFFGYAVRRFATMYSGDSS